jgi:salicylate hydroxylase
MDVVIAGAGVSGLAAAISLRRSGHRVTIYEKSSLNNEIGAAINVPPNVSRFLVPWGLDPVRYGFVSSQGLYIQSPTSLQDLSSYDHSHCVELFGAPLYYAHRVDLHKSLKHLATEPDGPGIPVTVHLKSGVGSYVRTISLVRRIPPCFISRRG